MEFRRAGRVRSVPGLIRRSPGPHAGRGVWDEPAAGIVPVPVLGGSVRLSGWFLAGRGNAQPAIDILLDGRLHERIAEFQVRPDVVAVHGDRRAGGGWCATIKIDDRLWRRVDVLGRDGASTVSLGRRYLRPVATVEGYLDHPRQGDVVSGRVVPVSGWVRFPGADTDVVDIFIDGTFVSRARRGDVRPDVRGALGSADPRDLVCGFTDVVPLRLLRAPTPRQSEISVLARSTDGRYWHPSPVTVQIGPDSTPAATMSRLEVQPWAAASWAGTLDARPARPKICVLAHSLDIGGAELHLQELLTRLAADDFADFLVISPKDGPLRGELEHAGIWVHLRTGYRAEPSGYSDQATELAALVGAFGCTVVLANTIDTFPAVDGLLGAGYRVVWTLHESFDLDEWIYLNRGEAGLDAEIRARLTTSLRRAETVFVSQATRRLFREQIPELASRCIGYGVDLDRIREYSAHHQRATLRKAAGFSADERILLCVGLVQERKAQLALVMAFGKIATAHPEVRLVLVGDQPTAYSATIHQVARESALLDHVTIVPVHSDIYRWFRLADALVSASDVESMPRSVMEAMAFGLPTLAADVFGLSELISDGMNGWLCEARSEISLVAGLRRVIAATDDELSAMSVHCRLRAQEFDGSRYALAYQQLLSEGGGQSRGDSR